MNTNNYRSHIFVAGTFALFAITFASIAMGFSYFHDLKNPQELNASISVDGEGEVTAIPDIATVNMTVRESAKTVPEAQKLVEEKVTKVLSSLKELDIEEKDTKTTSYTINPKYENRVVTTSSIYPTGYPQVSNPVVVGYEVAQSLEIKVRKVDSAGDVISAIGSAQVTELSGPYFTVDDMSKAEGEAREEAINNAKEKARKIARGLGVGLGDVISFYEDQNGNYPMMARMEMAGSSDAMNKVTLPQGENTVKSKVTITYSID